MSWLEHDLDDIAGPDDQWEIACFVSQDETEEYDDPAELPQSEIDAIQAKYDVRGMARDFMKARERRGAKRAS